MRRLRLARTPAPPLKTGRLKRAKGLRAVPHGDAATEEIISKAQRLIDSGWTVRKGGGEATKEKRWPLLPEWGGKEPPEKP
jgi:hypothetical protein